MEKCVFKHFFNFLSRHSIITHLQPGFMPGDSRVNQLLNIPDDIGRTLDAGKEVRDVVFWDISKAFDGVWHEGLLHKLQEIGICMCGEIENTKHFLLECEYYNIVRGQTIGSLPRQYNLQTLLYGNESSNTEENENIFKTVQTFIIDSGRFGL